ncbi:MAG: MerR family transcriptional regulator [Beijerinckiaceae bacterium]
MDKGADAYRTIGEAAEELQLPQHVLRFWETRFSQIRPMKRSGGRRYYRPEDVELLAAIRHLLYGEGYTIKGVQRILKQQGGRAVVDLVVQLREGAPAGEAAALMAGEGGREAQAVGAGQDYSENRDDPKAGGPAAREGTGEADAGAVPVVAAQPSGQRGLGPQAVTQMRSILAELEACASVLAHAREA